MMVLEKRVGCVMDVIQMSDLRLYQTGDRITYIEDVDFVDVLCNINKVAVDGNEYKDVVQVTFVEDEVDD